MRWVLYSFHKQFATQEEEGGVCLKLLSITAINIEQWKAWTSILILRMLLTAKHDHVFAASMVVLSTVEDEEEADNNTDNMSTNCTTEVYVTLTTAMTTIKLQYTQHSHAYPTLVLANTTFILTVPIKNTALSVQRTCVSSGYSGSLWTIVTIKR